MYSSCDCRNRTNVHYLVFHLTVADTITSFITLLMETVWRATIGVSSSDLSKIHCVASQVMLQWYADNFSCKALMMMRTGGYILSSNLLVVLSIDRSETGKPVWCT